MSAFSPAGILGGVSASSGWLRRAVVWAGHVPALRLIYGERLPSHLVRPNVAAVAMTLASIGIASALAPNGWRLLAGLIAWAVGHVAWGTYLAARLPDKRESSTPE